jgi:hypothetical protein
MILYLYNLKKGNFNMSWKEIVKKIEKDFEEGESRSDLFKKYKESDIKEGKKIKEQQLATIISSLKDQDLIEEYKTTNNILIGIMSVVSVINFLSLMASTGSIIFTFVIMLIPAFLIYGFVKNSLVAYNAYIILLMLNLPQTLQLMQEDPAVGLIALVVSLLMFLFVSKLKSNLFPYMGFFGAKKNKNQEYLITL